MSAMARPLKAPSTAPISMARAVPMPWAAAPSAKPRALGVAHAAAPENPLAEDAAEDPDTEDHHGGYRNVAAQRTHDRHGDGTVTDFGAIEVRICRSVPKAMAI